MIKQILSQKQQQKLSPLQIQQVKMLELTTLELENRIEQELEENPALEEDQDISSSDEHDQDSESGDNGEDFDSDSSSEEDLSLGDYLTEDDIPDYKLHQNNYSEESRREEIPYHESESFQEFLFDQLNLRNLTEDEIRVGEYLIGNIDEDGYLRRNLQSIADDLAFQTGMDVSVSFIEKVLKIVKEFDPPGIAASDLQECLLLQLKRKTETPIRKLAYEILSSFFDEFSKKHFDKISKVLSIDESELKEIIKEITLLNPKPGSAWESTIETKMAQVQPDFLVEAVNGELMFSMPKQNIPELKISSEYLQMLDEYSRSAGRNRHEQKEAVTFIKQKLDSAKWFIDAIKQRQNTLKETMLAIIEIQRDFFLTGDEANLKPMILKDVSILCKYDISTVSRVSNSKYVQTNYGIYPLKFFFSEALRKTEGEDVSSREVKAILKKMIDTEDKSKPLTDDSLVKMLNESGYEVARRTIAKYRDQLSIPVARLRKEI